MDKFIPFTAAAFLQRIEKLKLTVEVVLFILLKDIWRIQCVVKLLYTDRNGSFIVVWPSYTG